MSETEENNNIDTTDPVQKEVSDYEWLIRHSQTYYEEYKDCTSIRGRFQQYFVHGVTSDCNQWNRDYNNALKWEDCQDYRAAKDIIDSETIRRKERLAAHYGNKVWTKRKSPPEDWNKPLPDYLQEEYKNTYLDIKNKELKGEIEPTIDSKCSVM